MAEPCIHRSSSGGSSRFQGFSRLQNIVDSRRRSVLGKSDAPGLVPKGCTAKCCSSDSIPLLRPIRMVMEMVIMLVFRLWTAPRTDIGSTKFICKVFCPISQGYKPDFDSANTADF